MSLPAPARLGLPAQFQRWRPHQDEAIERVLRAYKESARVVGGVLPTGSGKTLLGAAVALLGGFRTAFLTASKGLQDQLSREFASLGLRDVRGAANYPCQLAEDGRTCERGICHAGAFCEWKLDGCDYFDAVRRGRSAALLNTNYDAWMSQYRFGEGFGSFDLVVCDEAHDLAGKLADALHVVLSREDVQWLGQSWAGGTDPQRWRQWARRIVAQEKGEDPPLVQSEAEIRTRLRRRRVLRDLAALSTIEDDWIVTEDRQGLAADPILVSPYAERWLFRHTPRLLLLSATLTPKIVEQLGLTGATLIEVPSVFPVSRRPVYVIPTCRMDAGVSPATIQQMMTRIDQFIGPRLDRKGIIHSVSYRRQEAILHYSRYSGIMFAPRGAATTVATVARFIEAPPPAVLVSPAVATGYNFPYRACEYQIIPKVPFPDTRSPIVAARAARDPDYRVAHALQQIVQAAGRGMRFEDDQCETAILDDHFHWVWNRHQRLAPSHFWEAVRWAETVPLPPAPLR